jgi:hypothetical protein
VKVKGLFGPSKEEIAADEKAMAKMSPQEKLNYASWKETNKETNVRFRITNND